MKQIKIIVYAIALSLLFPALYTEADPIKEEVYRYTWEEDDIISGFNQVSKSFYIPENTNISNLNISLKLKPSPTLVGDLSSISVLVNGTEVESRLIKDLDTSKALNIDVKDNAVTGGHNTITIKGFLKSTRHKCEINPDVNWVIIEKGSSYNFDFTRIESNYLYDIFDGSYYFDGTKGEVNLAVPNELSIENYNQLSSVSSLIGWINKSKNENLKINIIRYSELENLAKEAIVLGTPNQFKALDENLFKEEEWNIGHKKGIAALRKIGSSKHFILMTSNNKQIEQLNRVLSNKSLLAQMKTDTYVVNEDKIINDSAFNVKPTLSDLGYETISHVGNGLKEFNYYFTIPASKTLTENNKLSFAYNYSSISDLDEAYVIVEINGEKLFTKKLSEKNTEGRLEFSIPEEYFDYAGFNIGLSFNLKPNVENCVNQTFENVWIRIDSENSWFDLDTKDRDRYTLLSSYGILQDENGFLDANIKIEDYSKISLENISNISAYLGKVSEGVKGLYINDDRDVTAEFLTKNPIEIPEDKFIQNSDDLGFIGVNSENKLVILGNNIKQLNSAIGKYPHVISRNNLAILQDGKVLEYVNINDSDEEVLDKPIEDNTLDRDILIALIILIVFTLVVFLIYSKKIKKLS